VKIGAKPPEHIHGALAVASARYAPRPMAAALQLSSVRDGVLELRVENLAARIRDVNADLREGKRRGGIHTARLVLFYNDTGWRELPGLFRRIFRLLPVRALHVDDAVNVLFSVAAQMQPRGAYVTRALQQVERPPRLDELAIRSSLLSASGFDYLQSFVSGLSVLDVSNNHLEGAALKSLSQWSEASAALQDLRFGGNRPTARGIHALARDGHFPKLARIDLSSCELGSASVRLLFEGALPAVTDLSLAKNAFGDEGAATIGDSPWIERLATLDVSECGIGEGGAHALANSPHLRSIGRLDVRGNEIGDRGRKLLRDRFGDRALSS
jgi:hypothetical protein